MNNSKLQKPKKSISRKRFITSLNLLIVLIFLLEIIPLNNSNWSKALRFRAGHFWLGMRNPKSGKER